MAAQHILGAANGPADPYGKTSTHTNTIQSLKFLFYRIGEVNALYHLAKEENTGTTLNFLSSTNVCWGGAGILSKSLLLFSIG